MLWPFVLPFKITFFSMLGIIALATAIAPIIRVRRTIAFACVLGACVLLFIPSCSVVMKKIDATRFGEFKYSTTAEIQDSHAAYYIPPKATEIQMEDRWQAWGDSSVNRDEDWKSESDFGIKNLPIQFDSVKWSMPKPDVSYGGPIALDGAGFEIWYHRESKTAMLSGCYW